MPVAISHRRSLGHTTIQATLLDAVTATNVGTWVDCSGVYLLTVEVTGITTATVDLRGSNLLTRPNDVQDEVQIEDVTENSIIVVPFPIRWIKAAVSAYTSGTISAYLYGNQPS